MSPIEEPKLAGAPQYPELESTDGGWDPYVTSLLMGTAPQDSAADHATDEDAPVMTFSRPPSGRTPKR